MGHQRRLRINDPRTMHHALMSWGFCMVWHINAGLASMICLCSLSLAFPSSLPTGSKCVKANELHGAWWPSLGLGVGGHKFVQA